ncbi:membrane protein [Coprinopsis cinerea AmutBmut pab1-1]|nr:membrane protein [Coprinopsis cinerea AmutBmut pab1-1]
MSPVATSGFPPRPTGRWTIQHASLKRHETPSLFPFLEDLHWSRLPHPTMVTVAEEYIAMTRPQTNSERPDPVIQGRFIVDPMQAKEVFGDEVASKLKLSKDGTKILWPQPSDSSNDPQNWSNRRKATQLCVITLAVIVPGLVLGANTNLLFPLAEEFDTSPGEVNNLATNCSFIGSGLGGLFVPLLTRRYGRIPVLAWTQTIFLLALVGCTFAPSFGVFVAMRVLVGVFSVTPQVTGLYVVTDIYPFHLQPRKINIWATGTLVSVWISPFIVGFLATRLYWRWVYGVTCILGSITTLTTIVLGEETLYDRTRILDNEPDTTKLRYRIQTLLGITGWRLSHSRIGWGEGFLGLLKLFSRPHMFAMMVLQVQSPAP